LFNPENIIEKKSTLFSIVVAGVIVILSISIIIPHMLHTHYLKKLENNGVVKVVLGSKQVRYYSPNITEEESIVIKSLRKKLHVIYYLH
jgi:hypothetical protein